MDHVIYTLNWQDIDIEVIYYPLKWRHISYVSLESKQPHRAPLPVTDTGFVSRYFPPHDTPLTEAELLNHIQEWLNEAAQSKAWQRHVEASRQGDLFV